MPYESSYTGGQVDLSVRKVIARRLAAVAKIGDGADTRTITAGQVNTYQLLTTVLSSLALLGFVAEAGGIRYTGTEPLMFTFNGVATVGCDTNNTVVHFKLAINGVVKDETESAVKLASSTDLATINAASLVSLYQNDLVQVFVKADKACIVSSYHMQLVFMEV